MDCCGLSSTGLQDIDANDIIADNITIFASAGCCCGAAMSATVRQIQLKRQASDRPRVCLGSSSRLV
jgi:hypothetical protein